MAVELQVVLLIEMWHVVNNKTEDFIHSTNNRYIKFLANADIDGPINWPLSIRLNLNEQANDKFVEVLEAFIKEEMENE